MRRLQRLVALALAWPHASCEGMNTLGMEKLVGLALSLALGFAAMTSISSASANGEAPEEESGVSLDQIAKDLKGPGVVGEVHAVVAEQSLFVFTVRNPNDFFDFRHFSLVPKLPSVARSLSELQRHDRIRLHGELMENRSPQPHIEVSALEMVRAYDPGMPIPPYEREVTIPEDLPRDDQGRGEALFLVHAIHAGGKILVVEFKDAVLPVYVVDPALTKDLYRNDVIRMRYKVRRTPSAPTHLALRSDAGPAVELLESAVAKHGQPADVTGPLVMFPKSPQVLFDVFAVHEDVEGGATRQYTLINFGSPEVFHAIRQKCADAWARDPDTVRNGRNKLIHERIRVRARGVFNVVDPNQANVQIKLESADDLELLVD